MLKRCALVRVYVYGYDYGISEFRWKEGGGLGEGRGGYFVPVVTSQEREYKEFYGNGKKNKE